MTTAENERASEIKTETCKRAVLLVTTFTFASFLTRSPFDKFVLLPDKVS